MPFWQIAGEVQSESFAQPFPGFVQVPAMQVFGDWHSLSEVQDPFGATQDSATQSQLVGQSEFTVQVLGTHAPVMHVASEAQSLFLLQTAVPEGTQASPPCTAAQV